MVVTALTFTKLQVRRRSSLEEPEAKGAHPEAVPQTAIPEVMRFADAAP
jgi:hypothetical protein